MIRLKLVCIGLALAVFAVFIAVGTIAASEDIACDQPLVLFVIASSASAFGVMLFLMIEATLNHCTMKMGGYLSGFLRAMAGLALTLLLAFVIVGIVLVYDSTTCEDTSKASKVSASWLSIAPPVILLVPNVPRFGDGASMTGPSFSHGGTQLWRALHAFRVGLPSGSGSRALQRS